MKTVVFGYHDMGCTGLKALLEAGYNVVAVFSHADAAGENHFHGSLAQMARERAIPVFMPEEVNHPAVVAQVAALTPEVIFCFSYRQALNEQIRASATFGAFNVHASLLPAHRGRAHLNWALIKGDTETGITLHRMTSQPDAGPILAQEKVHITPEDDVFSLHHKLVNTTGVMLRSWLPALQAGQLIETAQDESRASCFGARKPGDGRIHWRDSAENIHNLVRALTQPWPGAFSDYHDTRFIVWKSRFTSVPSSQAAGTLLSVDPLILACGSGQLEILSGGIDAGIVLSGAELAVKSGMQVGERVNG